MSPLYFSVKNPVLALASIHHSHRQNEFCHPCISAFSSHSGKIPMSASILHLFSSILQMFQHTIDMKEV